MAPKSNGHDRTRIWSAIIYPESAPENWREILDDHHIEWAESPLHEFDTDLTGETKKAHWHIVLAFDGPKSYDQVADLLRPLNCPAPQKCHSLKGAVRYFAHLDNPDKFQYPTSEIIGHGGFDVESALAPSSSAKHEIIREMMAWCKDHDVCEFSDLCDYASTDRPDDWFSALCDYATLVMQAYLRSRRWKMNPPRGEGG